MGYRNPLLFDEMRDIENLCVRNQAEFLPKVYVSLTIYTEDPGSKLPFVIYFLKRMLFIE